MKSYKGQGAAPARQCVQGGPLASSIASIKLLELYEDLPIPAIGHSEYLFTMEDIPDACASWSM